MSSAKKQKNPHFRLRIRGREQDSPYSEKEILKKIMAGRLTGDEEVSAEPFDKWQKIAAHPLFYDAFLKRLYSDDYESPDKTALQVSIEGKESSEADDQKPATAHRATSQEDGNNRTRRLNPEDSDEGKTSQLPGTQNKESSIGSLFSDLFSAGQPPPNQNEVNWDLDPAAAADPLLLENPEPPASSPELTRKLDIGGDVSAAESPEVAALRKRRRLTKQALIGTLVVLALVFLFEGGGKNTSQTRPRQADVSRGSDKVLVNDLLATPERKKQKVTVLLAEGERLVENDTPLFYVGAQEYFVEALVLNETNIAILGSLAETTARLYPESTASDGLDEQLRDYVKRGRAIDPQFSQFYLSEALFALYSDKPEEARKLIQNALATDPSNINNYLGKGEVLYGTGDFAGARAALIEVLKANPGVIRAHHLLARIALEQKDYDTARRQSLESLRLNPIHASSYYVLGKVSAETGKFDEAKQLYETCVGLAQFGARRDIGRAYYQLGKLQELTGGKEAKRNYQLAYYYYWPDTKEALKEKLAGDQLEDGALRKLAVANEYGTAYFAEQATSLVAQRKYPEALTFLEAAALLQPNDGEALVRIGEVVEKIAVRQDDIQAVSIYYERAIERQPDLGKAYIRLGLFESEQYNLDRAYRLLQQAVALNPQEADPYVGLGKHYFRTQDYKSSIESFQKAYELNPGDADILYYAGLLRPLARGAGGEKEAADFFKRAYLLNTQHYDSLVEWLKISAKLGDKLFGVKFVRNLLETDPINANLYWVLGEIYAANKEHRKAVDYYHKALDLDKRLSKVRMSTGRSLEAIGDFATAAEEYRFASQLDPKNHEGYFKAGEIYFQMKRYDYAQGFFNRLLERCPNYPGTRRLLSRIAVIRGQREEALSLMKAEVDRNPLNSKFRIEYAQLLMDFGKYEDAVTQLTEVTNHPLAKERGDKADFAYERLRGYLLLSRCFRALNRFESAEGAIRLALQTDQTDPELHRELGYVYHGLQRDKEAVKAFEYYLQRNPAASDGPTIKSLIKGMQIEE